jgi:hypothetical protein
MEQNNTIPMEIELYNPATNATFKAPFYQFLNGKRFDELSRINATYRDLKKEAKMFYMTAKLTPRVAKENLQGNEEQNNVLTQIIEGITDGSLSESDVLLFLTSAEGNVEKGNIYKDFEIIKIMLDDRQLPTELKALISSPVIEKVTEDGVDKYIDSPFWFNENQDIMKVREISNSFRGLLSK